MTKNKHPKAPAAPKQRNPFVQHLIQRNGAGMHVKSFKAYRAQEKSKLRRELD